MGVRDASAFLNFTQSETDKYKDCADGANDPEFHLSLRFQKNITTDRHPYGDGHAEQTTWEPDRGSMEFELDGVPISEEDLIVCFGQEWFDRTVETLLDRATED